jgi:hypothetical protein
LHPEDKPRRPTPSQIAAYDEGRASDAAEKSVLYWREVDADPHGYMTKEEFEELCLAGEVLKRDPAAAAVLGGLPEVTMAYRDEETGLWVLSRPDTISLSGVVADYKRWTPAGRPFDARFVDRRIEDGGVDMQIALGFTAFERLIFDRPNAGGIVAQLGVPPFHVIVRGMDDEDLRIAEWRNRRSIRRFAECLDSGRWPGPGEVVSNYSMRKDLRERLLAEMNTEHQAP